MMDDEPKAKDQLIRELDQARRTIAELEHAVYESRQALETLHGQEEIYRIHFSLSNDVMFHWDNQFKILHISPNVERILGYSPDELVGKHFYELNLLDQEDMEEAMENAMLLLSGKRVYSSIFRFIAKNGEAKFGELSEIPIVKDGKVVEVITVAREITDRIRMLESLRDREETAQALLNATTDSLILLDPEGTILALNDAAARDLGKSVKQVMGSSISDHVTIEVMKRRRPYFDKVNSSGRPLRFVDESQGRTFSISLFPVKDIQGRVISTAVYGQELHKLHPNSFR